MSITTRAKTRPRAEAVVAALAAHPDFADLIAEDKLEILYNATASGKKGLDSRLEQRVAKIKGILITITPVSGNNTAGGRDKVANDTRLAVNVWNRPSMEDEGLPEPLDLLDEVQRVLAEAELTFPTTAGLSGNTLPVNEQLRVGGWVEVPDSTYLNHEVQVTCLVPLGNSSI